MIIPGIDPAGHCPITLVAEPETDSGSLVNALVIRLSIGTTTTTYDPFGSDAYGLHAHNLPHNGKYANGLLDIFDLAVASGKKIVGH